MKQILLFSMSLFLLIGCGSGSNSDTNTAQSNLQAWYMRTIAEATAPDGTIYKHKTAGIFGELAESQDGKDTNDIAALGASTLQVVFPQSNWDEYSGDYFSDYRALAKEDTKQVWTFQVKNYNTELHVNLANAPLKITLEGPYDVKRIVKNGYFSYDEKLSKDTSRKTSITLIDIDNQKSYSYDELASTELNMDGLNVRTFKWVLGPVNNEDFNTSKISNATVNTKITGFNTEPTLSRNLSNSTSNSKFGYPPTL